MIEALCRVVGQVVGVTGESPKNDRPDAGPTEMAVEKVVRDRLCCATRVCTSAGTIKR